MTADFMNLLDSSLRETGRSLRVSSEEVQRTISEQLVQLALAVGEPGYDRVVIAARDIVAMEIGLQAASEADAIDSRILGVLQGGLFFGAQALKGGTPA